MIIKQRIVSAAFLGLAVVQSARGEGDPQGARNLAAEGKLPQGQGIAASYPGDGGITAHADVIFADNFEAGELGSRWDSIRNDKERYCR